MADAEGRSPLTAFRLPPSTLSPLLLLPCLLLLACSRMVWETAWENDYRILVQAFDIATTPDNGFVIVGSGFPPEGGWCDVSVVRADEFGDTLWTRQFSGAGPDWACSVIMHEDGRFLVAGTRSNRYAWLLLLEDDGDTVWTRSLGDGENRLVCQDCIQTHDSGYALVGYCDSASGPDVTVLLRTDAQGELLWRQDWNLGVGLALAETEDHGFILTTDEGVFARTDSVGDSLSYQRLFETYASLAPEPFGDFYAAGRVSAGYGYDIDIAVTRLDQDGRDLWQRALTENRRQYAHQVRTTLDGGCAVAGYHGNPWDEEGFSRAVLLRFDGGGGLRWWSDFGDDGTITCCVVETPDHWLVTPAFNTFDERFTLVKVRPW